MEGGPQGRGRVVWDVGLGDLGVVDLRTIEGGVSVEVQGEEERGKGVGQDMNSGLKVDGGDDCRRCMNGVCRAK